MPRAERNGGGAAARAKAVGFPATRSGRFLPVAAQRFSLKAFSFPGSIPSCEGKPCRPSVAALRVWTEVVLHQLLSEQFCEENAQRVVLV